MLDSPSRKTASVLVSETAVVAVALDIDIDSIHSHVAAQRSEHTVDQGWALVSDNLLRTSAQVSEVLVELNTDIGLRRFHVVVTDWIYCHVFQLDLARIVSQEWVLVSCSRTC